MYINIVMILSHSLVFQEYCALMESRILLGPGLLLAWELLRVPIVLMNRHYKTDPAVILDCRFSLFSDYLCSCKLIKKR